LHIIKKFLDLIEKNIENLRSEQVLAMNVRFHEACQLNKMLSDTGLKPEICQEKEKRRNELYEEMK